MRLQSYESTSSSLPEVELFNKITLDRPSENPRDICFNQDGSLIAVGMMHRNAKFGVLLYETATGNFLKNWKLSAHGMIVRFVPSSSSSSSNYYFSRGDDDEESKNNNILAVVTGGAVKFFDVDAAVKQKKKQLEEKEEEKEKEKEEEYLLFELKNFASGNPLLRTLVFSPDGEKCFVIDDKVYCFQRNRSDNNSNISSFGYSLISTVEISSTLPMCNRTVLTFSNNRFLLFGGGTSSRDSKSNIAVFDVSSVFCHHQQEQEQQEVEVEEEKEKEKSEKKEKIKIENLTQNKNFGFCEAFAPISGTVYGMSLHPRYSNLIAVSTFSRDDAIAIYDISLNKQQQEQEQEQEEETTTSTTTTRNKRLCCKSSCQLDDISAQVVFVPPHGALVVCGTHKGSIFIFRFSFEEAKIVTEQTFGIYNNNNNNSVTTTRRLASAKNFTLTPFRKTFSVDDQYQSQCWGLFSCMANFPFFPVSSEKGDDDEEGRESERRVFRGTLVAASGQSTTDAHAVIKVFHADIGDLLWKTRKFLFLARECSEKENIKACFGIYRILFLSCLFCDF